MSLAGALIFPMLIIAVMAIYLIAVVKFGQKVAGSIQSKIDPSLPTTPETKSFSVGEINIQMIYQPSQVKGRTRVPATLRYRAERSLGSAVFLSPELKGDLFLKAAGLSQEAEVGDTDVDQCFHFVAQDASLAREWVSSTDVREQLLKIGNRGGFEYLEIGESFSQLHFSFYLLPQGKTYEENNLEIAELFGGLLTQAERVFGSQPTEQVRSFSRKFRLYESRWPQGLFSFGIIVSFLAFTTAQFSSGHLVHFGQGILLLGAFILLILAALTFMFRPAIRNLQLPSKIFFTIFFGVVINAVVLGTAASLYLNSHCDHSEPSRKRELVTNKWIARGSRGATYYNLEVASLQLQVNQRVFERVQAGKTTAVLDIHAGFFRLPWYQLLGFYD